MHFRFIFYVVLFVVTWQKPAVQHPDRIDYIKTRICNFQTCEKCEIEISRNHGGTHMGRMCQLIKKIKDCCANLIIIPVLGQAGK